MVDFHDGQLTVSVSHNNKPLYHGIARGSYSGSPYSGLMNVDYLVDAVQTMPGDAVEIVLQKGSNEAWTIRGQSGYTAVIMPIDMEGEGKNGCNTKTH